MSRFGTAFLSLDAGQTFFEPSPGANSICDYASTTSSLTTASSHFSAVFPSTLGAAGAIASALDAGAGGDALTGSDKEREEGELRILLEQLRDEQQVKWAHRAQLLQQLQGCATSDPALLPDVLRYSMEDRYYFFSCTNHSYRCIQ